MRIKPVVCLLAFLSLFVLIQCALADETNSVTSDLTSIKMRMDAKLMQNLRSESDFAPELAELDALMTKYKDAPPQEIANVYMLKVNVLMQVFQDPEKAVAVLKQFKTNMPMIEVNGNTDAVIATFQMFAEQKKIQTELAIGKQFPEFSETGLSGKSFSLSAYKGKLVLVDFWATTCPPCVGELPNLLATYKKYHAKGFEIAGISLDTDQTKLQAFLKQRGMEWPQFFDGQGFQNKLAVKYGVQAIPATYLLDGEGKIIAKNMRGDELEKAVAAALGKP